jgi:hypothetical protein
MRTCTIEGCDRKHLAKGLCGIHYNATYRKPNPTAEFSCPTCGVTFIKERARANRYERLFCSTICRDRKRTAEAQSVVIWKPRPSLHVFIDRMPTPAKTRRARAFMCGSCRVCAQPFADLYGSVTCSAVCQALSDRASKQEAKHRRRARQRDAFIAPVRRHEVYQRDDWTCQLCHTPVDRDAVVPDPAAPTLDHIRALANGGTHEPSNVQTAHFMCNALKGHRDWTHVRMATA